MAAVAVRDFGPCAGCGTNNSHQLSKCRECGAVLQWAKDKVAKATSAAPPPIPKAVSTSVPGAHANAVHQGVPQVYNGQASQLPLNGAPVAQRWKPGDHVKQHDGSFTTEMWGLLILSFFIPIIGFGLYRYYSVSMEDEYKAGPCLTGAVIGFIFWVVGRLGWMFLRVG